MSKKDEKAEKAEGTIEALGEEAAKSFTKSVEKEQKERQPTSKAGMPAETDFTTPRVHQGSEGEGNRQQSEGEDRPRSRS